MFELSQEYRLVKNELTALNAFEKYACFECFMDSVFTFGFYIDNIYCQVNFICDDSFSKEILVSDLLHLKRICYFSLSTFETEKNKADVLIKEINWSMNLKIGIN